MQSSQQAHYPPDLGWAQAIFDKHTSSLGDTRTPGQGQSQLMGETGLIVTDGPTAYLLLLSSTQRLGVLALVAKTYSKQTGYTPGEQRLLQVFANHVALANTPGLFGKLPRLKL